MPDSSLGTPLKVLLTLAALVVIATGIKAADQLMVPFLLSIFIATIAATPVFWLEARRVPAALAISGVMVAIVLALVGVSALLVRSGNAFTDRLPFYQDRINALVGDAVRWLDGLGVDYIDKRNDLIRAVSAEDAQRVAKKLWSDPLSVVTVGPEAAEPAGG